MEDRKLLETLWNKVNSLETRMAVAESNIEQIKEDINSIKGNTVWILRLIIGGLIGGFITFLLSGGLTL